MDVDVIHDRGSRFFVISAHSNVLSLFLSAQCNRPIGSYQEARAGKSHTNRVLSSSYSSLNRSSGLIQLQHTADRRPIGSYTATAYGRQATNRVLYSYSIRQTIWSWSNTLRSFKTQRGVLAARFYTATATYSRSQQVNSSHSGITA